MQEKKEGASPEAQVIHHAKELYRVREVRRAARRADDKAQLKVATEAEYQQGLVLDKAVRRLPP